MATVDGFLKQRDRLLVATQSLEGIREADKRVDMPGSICRTRPYWRLRRLADLPDGTLGPDQASLPGALPRLTSLRHQRERAVKVPIQTLRRLCPYCTKLPPSLTSRTQVTRLRARATDDRSRNTNHGR